MALFPSDQILLTWSKVEDARAYEGLTKDRSSAAEEKLCFLGRVSSCATFWTRETAEAKVKNGSVERQLTMVEAAQVRLVQDVQDGAAGNLFTDADPFASGSGDSSIAVRKCLCSEQAQAVFHRRPWGPHGH